MKLLIASVVLFRISLYAWTAVALNRDKIGGRTDKKKGGISRNSKKGYG